MQMGEEQVADIGRVDVDAHQLTRRAMPAIEHQVAAAVERDQDRGVAAIGVGQCRAGSEHHDPHGQALLSRFIMDGLGDKQKSHYDIE